MDKLILELVGTFSIYSNLELFRREHKQEVILRSVWMFGNMFVYLFYAKSRIHVYSTITRDDTQ
jgi:hypothetical protein